MKKSFLLLFTICLAAYSFCQQTNKFTGAWFDIDYPRTFTARGSMLSTTADGFESAFFRSPDSLVEFYIFSPQWNGEPTDIMLTPSESMSSSKTENGKEISVKFWTISAKNGSYMRSYQETYNRSFNTKWVVGIKYKNKSAYDHYKDQYIKFKKSLKQYAD